MPKLYEILLRKVGLMEEEEIPDQVDLIYNPIKVQCGSSLSINELDYKGLNFFVQEIRDNHVSVAGNNHNFVDYLLKATALDGKDVQVRLRLQPENSDSFCTHRVILMNLYDSLSYDEGLEGVVRDSTGIFQVDHDDKEPDQYWRPNQSGTDDYEPLLESWNTRVRLLRDKNSDGKVEEAEILTENIEAWDYARLTEIDGVSTDQYLFVEMNKENGWFQIWQGVELNPEQIEVF